MSIFNYDGGRISNLSLIEPTSVFSDVDDTLFGSTGNDNINLSGVTAWTIGGAFELEELRTELSSGDDLFVGSTLNDVVLGGPGHDTIDGSIGDDVLEGGSGIDQISGGPGDDTIRHGIGGISSDLFFGGPGDDRLVLTGDPNTFRSLILDASASIELLQGSGGPVTGTSSSDFFDISGLLDISFVFSFDLAAGNDSFVGSVLSDEVSGGRGADRIVGGDGDDTISGGEGLDTLVGGAGDDLFEAYDTTEFTFEGAEAVIRGGEGADRLTLALGPNFGYLDMGPSASVEVLRFRVDIFGNIDPLGGTAGNDFIDIRSVEVFENSDNGVGRAQIVGLSGEDTLYGSRISERINGGGGDDTLNGWIGDDTLEGGTGADLLVGGQGSDLLLVDDAGDRVSESRRWDGVDTVISSVSFRTGNSHIENIELTGDAVIGAGNGLRNLITGNDGDNILDGGKNVDTLIGGAGDDTYLLRAPGDTAIETADGGIDTVRSFGSFRLDAHIEKLFMQTVRAKDGSPTQFNGIGNGIDNTIVGTPFENTLVGREGSDTLRGQAGADTFVFDRAIGTDVDRIVDFNANEANEGDILKLKGSLFGGLTAGDLAGGAFHAGTMAADAADRLIFDQASGQLWFDADGSGAGAQILFARFDQNATVTAADIEVF